MTMETKFKACFSSSDTHVAISTFVESIDRNGLPSIEQYLSQIDDEMKDKDPNKRNVACSIIRALIKGIGNAMVPYCVPLLATMLDLCADKKPLVGKGAKANIVAITQELCVMPLHQIVEICATCAKFGLGRTKGWQTKVASMTLLKAMAEKSPLDQEVLSIIIPMLCECVWDTKKEVKELAHDTLTKVSGAIGNRDIELFIPAIVNAIADKEVADCINKLARTTFVQVCTIKYTNILFPWQSNDVPPKRTV